MPKTVRWRGIDVDPDTADMLTAIAKAAGDDIYVQGIPGYGSYRANAASGGTDTGGGHADLNMVGYNEEQCRRLETVARSKGACAYWRPERRPDGTRYGWQNHVHILRMDCPDLSPAARSQVADYLAGYDGLYYGPGVKRKDSGTRSYTSRRWLTLSASLGGPVLPPRLPVPTIPAPLPAGGLTVANIDDARALFTQFPILKDMTAANPDTAKRVTPSNQLEAAVRLAKSADTRAARIEAALAALDKKVTAGTTGPVTDEQLERVLRKVIGSVDGKS